MTKGMVGVSRYSMIKLGPISIFISKVRCLLLFMISRKMYLACAAAFHISVALCYSTGFEGHSKKEVMHSLRIVIRYNHTVVA